MNAANLIRSLFGMPVGWEFTGRMLHHRKAGPGRVHNLQPPFYNSEMKTRVRRNDKFYAELEGNPQHLRRFKKAHTHVLTAHVTDKNKAALANK